MYVVILLEILPSQCTVLNYIDLGDSKFDWQLMSVVLMLERKVLGLCLERPRHIGAENTLRGCRIKSSRCRRKCLQVWEPGWHRKQRTR